MKESMTEEATTTRDEDRAGALASVSFMAVPALNSIFGARVYRRDIRGTADARPLRINPLQRRGVQT
jgi:hypothetical protein